MIQSIARAIDILEVLKDPNRSFSIAEVAEATKLPSSTVHRILQSLSYKTYVLKNEETHLYQLGPGLIPLGISAMHHTKLMDVAPAIVKKLSIETNEDSFLVTRAGYKGYVIEKSEGTNSLKIIEKFGNEMDLHCGAIRKAMLANLSESFINDYIKYGLTSYTDKTIIDGDQLLKDLEKIRKEGVAVSYGEYLHGACGIGAPVFDFSNEAIASIGIIAPEFRVDEVQLKKYKTLVKQYAHELSTLLGHTDFKLK